MKTIEQKKYFKNLYTDNKNIYSYDTKVAKINHEQKKVICLNWFVDGKTSSPTTTKHINYIAKLLNYKVIKN